MHKDCSICGVFIRPSSWVSGIALPPANDLKWDQTLRAVRRDNVDSTATITGIGYLNSSGEAIVPQDPGGSYADTNASLKLYPLRGPDSTGTWTFIVHAACWEILLDRVSACPSQVNKAAKILHNLLHCTTWNPYSRFHAGHDPGVAAKFQRRVHVQLQEMADGKSAHLAAEPSRFHYVEDILYSSKRLAATTGHFVPGRLSGGSSAFDIFAKLPVEVIHLLLILLPSEDVWRLRMSSKFVACVSRPAVLPQSFWRSRFLPDLEMGFALPAHTDGFQDWRNLYFVIRHSINDPQGSARLRNRKRVWDIVSRNASLFASHLSGTELDGEPLPHIEYPTSRTQPDPALPRCGKVITTQMTTRNALLLSVGSRQLFDRSIRLRLSRSNLITISVATVVFHSQTFISGLCFVFRDTATCTDYSNSLGYVPSDSIVTLQIAPDQVFVGFELATRVDGIIAARAILETRSRTYPTAWVGDIGHEGPDIAFGSLSVGRKAESIDLVASFDAFKMIALAISPGYGPQLSELNLQEFAPQYLWTPCCPRDTTMVPTPKRIVRQSFQPVLNIDFGGAGGQNLEKLTRIVVHMYSRRDAIVGFTFYFIGQKPLLRGRQGNIEISFFINGPEGERISSVSFEDPSKVVGIGLLQIFTSFGNSIVITPDQLRIERREEPLSYHFRGEVTYSTVSLHAPKGQTITGFTSTLTVDEFYIGSFQHFGLQCELIPGSAVQGRGSKKSAYDSSLPVRQLFSEVGSHLIDEESTGCKGYTYGSLHNVKQIRFSCGSEGRPRQAHEVSGMWLDYFNSQPPSIVGQWISETDSLVLGKDERLVGLTIWMSKLRHSTTENYPLGRVVRISISTSYKRSIAVPKEMSLSINDCVVLKFRENKFEKLPYLLWAFNSACDYPRAPPSPISTTDRVFIWSPTSLAPWIVPQKVLWEETSETGDIDRVISISGYRATNPVCRYTLTGLKFAYQSGATVTIGCTYGEPTAEVFFESNSIHRIEWFTDLFGLFEMIFHCKGREHTYSKEYALVGDPVESIVRHDMAPVICCERVDIASRTYQVLTTERSGVKKEFSPTDLPNGEAVGLWGFNLGEGDLTLGLVYVERQ